jgi:hypothetical protein
MTKPSRRLPGSGGLFSYLVSLVPGEKPISRFTIDWPQIERAYGKPLSAEVRKAIDAATLFFVISEEPERTGKPVGEAQKIVEACKRCASEFHRALPSLQSDNEGYAAMHFISKNLNDPRLRDGKLFVGLHRVLISFNDACNAALKELSEFPFSKEGDEWSWWIQRLNRIMKNNKLPAGVRKDAGNKSKTDTPSPFTLLVAELQSCLPRECRRHTHSEGGLAVAISRALGSNKLPACP